MYRALASLFDCSEAGPLEIKGGELLYRAGDAAQAIYLVRSGGITIIRGGDTAVSPAGIVRPGEIVGEASALAGTERSTTAVALRDSDVVALPTPHFIRALSANPDAMGELARLLILRTQAADPDFMRAQPSVVAVVATGVKHHAAAWMKRLAKSMEMMGLSVAQLGAANEPVASAQWSQIESDHDIVLCAVEYDQAHWRSLCQRQVDRILLLGCATEDCLSDADQFVEQSLQRSGLVDLALTGPASLDVRNWLDRLKPARLFRSVDEDREIARIARMLAGRGVGVVLSGGGARAFAHVGAIRALRRANVPIDSICGTSMGAIVAACVAMGWSDDEIDARLRQAFVDSSPLDDIAFPFVAMTKGRKVERRLRKHFGETDIANLQLPYFCVSTDLNAGEDVVHRRGCLTTALRASISLPGILPPVLDGDRVLVDGGVLRNLPSELLRSGHHGPIIGVDVSQAKGLMAADVARPSPLLQWVWSGKWRKGPPIVSLLMRSATVGSGPDLARSRAACDLYVMPDVEQIEIRNWRAYDRAVEAGDLAMTKALADLTDPVTDLHKRRAMGMVAMPTDGSA